MSPELVRQRRNLIAVSAVLLIFDFARIEITKVSVLGTELLVGDAQVLMVCAWVLWAYFFLRYYQYWRMDEERHIRDAFRKRLRHYARSYTKAKPIQDGYGQRFDNFKIVRTGFVSWCLVLQDYNPAKGSVEGVHHFKLPVWRLPIWSLRAVSHVGLQTPHATNHVLPFVLAVAAPAVTLIAKW